MPLILLDPPTCLVEPRWPQHVDHVAAEYLTWTSDSEECGGGVQRLGLQCHVIIHQQHVGCTGDVPGCKKASGEAAGTAEIVLLDKCDPCAKGGRQQGEGGVDGKARLALIHDNNLWQVTPAIRFSRESREYGAQLLFPPEGAENWHQPNWNSNRRIRRAPLQGFHHAATAERHDLGEETPTGGRHQRRR